MMKVIKDGSHFSMSRYDEETETWKLNSLDESVSGTSPASIASMGTGLQSWQFDKYLKFIYGHHIMVTPFFSGLGTGLQSFQYCVSFILNKLSLYKYIKFSVIL